MRNALLCRYLFVPIGCMVCNNQQSTLYHSLSAVQWFPIALRVQFLFFGFCIFLRLFGLFLLFRFFMFFGGPIISCIGVCPDIGILMPFSRFIAIISVPVSVSLVVVAFSIPYTSPILAHRFFFFFFLFYFPVLIPLFVA